MPLEAALERELVLVEIGEAGIDELDLRHGGPFWRIAPCPQAEVLHEGDVGKNPAGLALWDAESTVGRQRHPSGQSAPTAHERRQIRQAAKSLIQKRNHRLQRSRWSLILCRNGQITPEMDIL
ncbi:hypothetical protein [Rhodovulum sulfidophilum]|uniref:hypothetical protein n=1 Tax=Rhodovulum sulfidophilum TaxID=35806 RepID=UPI001912EE9D|nr:hypothetical protein [Rhodovulum sulfidophilum]